MALADLYSDCEPAMFADSPSIETDPDIFTNAARVIYDAGRFDASMISDPAIRAQIEQTFNAINTAIDEGIGYDVPAVLRYALENNAFIFSGFKTYHSMRELGLSLLTDKGDIKPFNKFLDDALAINAVYNKNYLFAEYKHAVAASQMALRWHEFQKDGDLYNLQYRTAADSRVREEHALLHNTTLPVDDPFWDSFFPPNGWGCRCTAVQVRKSKYPLSDRDLAMKRGNNCTDGVKKKIFRYNPGKSLQLFPPKHPYYKAPNADKKAIDGYTPVEWTPKTVKEAEQFYRDKLGVNCSLAGFTSKNMAQIESIFRSVEEHFQRFPEIKKETLFVGSILGRIKLLFERKLAELKADPYYAKLGDDILKKEVSKWITRMKVRAGKNTYAYSHGAFKSWGLSGIAFNTSWAGEKIDKSLANDVNSKWHPPGCASLKAVFDHELGHEIDRLIGLRSNSEFLKIFEPEHSNGKKYITENLSSYGNTNSAEFIAEAWSEYLNNEKPRPIAAAVGMLIKKLYAEKYQSSRSS